MAEHNPQPELAQVDVRVRCVCGELNEFDDVSLGSMVSQPCDDCGQRVEVSIDGFAQIVERDR